MHLKKFKSKTKAKKSKTKQKIDLNYSDNVDDEKLQIKQQASVVMRASRKDETLKEKMQRIKKKPNILLPPIESRMETDFSQKQTPNTFEREHHQTDLLKKIEESQEANLGHFKASSLPVPKMAHLEAEILKQNINTDVVWKELTLEEKAEQMDSRAPDVNSTSYEKPEVSRKEAKKLIYLEADSADYARVDTITLTKKPDRVEIAKKMNSQSGEFSQTKPVNTTNVNKQPYQIQDWGRADIGGLPSNNKMNVI